MPIWGIFAFSQVIVAHGPQTYVHICTLPEHSNVNTPPPAPAAASLEPKFI